MYGYWSRATLNARDAREHPTFARIQSAGPFGYFPFTYGGSPGVFAALKVDGHQLGQTLEEYGAPRTCPDGLVYFPSKVPIPQNRLVKSVGVRGIDIMTSRGAYLTIPLVSVAPKFVSFTGGAMEPATRLEELAVRVWARLECIQEANAAAKAAGQTPSEILPIDDPEVLEVVVQAIMENYRVTPESLNDQRWVTTVDIQPILYALEGIDPKSVAAGKLTSPSSPAA